MKISVKFFALVIVLLVVGFMGCTPSDNTTVFKNVKGYTIVDDSLHQFSVLAVKGDEIVYVGDNIDELKGGKLQVRDLDGQTMLPGLIDAHGHIMGLGYKRLDVDITGLKTKKETIDKLTEYAREHPDIDWIRGRGWNHTMWTDTDGSFPTSEDLTGVADDRPIVLERVDGHATWVNQKALEIGNVSKETPEIDGGKVLRDEYGNPTGILVDKASNLIYNEVPGRTVEERKMALELALEELRRVGLTSVHDAGISKPVYDLYRTFASENKLTSRIHAMIGGTGEDFDQISKDGVVENMSDHTLSVRSVKLYEDGALGSRGAALLQPYSDDPDNRGLLFYSEDTLYAQAKKATDKGYQVNIHAIGDRANRVVLNVFERLRMESSDDPEPLRHRVEHAQVVHPDDLPRFGDLDIIASMQPTHATSDMNMAGDRLGEERMEGAYAWKTLADMGTKMAGGSDFPVESSNPFYGLYSAITRQNHDGKPTGGWYPEQRLSRTEALAWFTTKAAYAGYQESFTGSLQEGMKADFIIVDRDLFSVPEIEIKDTKVLETWMNGKQVFQASDN